MKTTQYIRQEKSIAAADGSTIRERWLWGLRLLHDEQAMTPNGNLRHGVIDRLVQASRSQGIALSEREIQRRLTCARTYPTEEQIRHAVADFESWRELASANFPPIELPPEATPADYRTKAERQHDLARALADIMAGQEGLWPLSKFEPVTTTLKDMADYIIDQDRITEGFRAANEKRREYHEKLLAAVGGDESKTWLEAHQVAYPDDDDSR